MTDARTRRGLSVRPGVTIFAILALLVTGLTVLIARPTGDRAADLTGYPAGITAAGVARASALTVNSNMPAALLAAIPRSNGTDPMAPARAYTSSETTAAIQNRQPIGPYGLVYNDVIAFARTYHVLPLSFSAMADPVSSGNWLVGAAAAVIQSKHLGAAAVSFTAGTTPQPWYDPKSNNINQRTLLQTAAAAGERATSRRSWIAILSALPVASIGPRAASIYDTAFNWTVLGSLSQMCGGYPLTYANERIIPIPGIWANPVSSSGILTPFGSTHDGVDLAAPAGAPVYAAASGMVKLVGSLPAIAATGGKYALVVYTGNGTTLAYQDLGSDAVSDGQQVRAGQVLGTVAAAPTDHGASGAHLHFGVNTVHAVADNGATWVDPIVFMGARGISLGAPAGAPTRRPVTSATVVRTTEAASATRGLMDVWQGSQLSTASTIISTGQRMYVPQWGIQIALMTAMQGSRLGIDPAPSSSDVRGVFALPSSWGSVSARMDVAMAARAFYGRLVHVPSWQTLPPWVAAAATRAYAATSAESYRAKWSGAGVILNVFGVNGTTSTYGTEQTVGGGCTGAPAPGTPTVSLSAGFKVASFNMYGCTESYNAWQQGHWLSCTQRLPLQWSYINQHGFSIVGLQELEPAPFQLLQQRVNTPGSNWAMYPTTPQYVHQQTTAVLWRTDQWQMLSGQEFQIPKYAWTDSTGTHLTYANEARVLLRNAAGQKLWVISIHNISGMDAMAHASGVAAPVGSFGKLLGQDVGIESQQFANAYGTGMPVVMMGDFNDDTVSPICRVKQGTPSAHSIWDPIPAGGCANPGSTHGQPGDKIFGSGEVTFSGSGIDWGTVTSGPAYVSPTGQRTTTGITDHGIPSTLAKVP